eukprot:8399428-Karenia_brevis.AAC.1
MQAAYATVCARHKCYKGAERTHQAYSGSAPYKVSSHTPGIGGGDHSAIVYHVGTSEHSAGHSDESIP